MGNTLAYRTVSMHMVHEKIDPLKWKEFLTPEEFEQLKQSKLLQQEENDTESKNLQDLSKFQKRQKSPHSHAPPEISLTSESDSSQLCPSTEIEPQHSNATQQSPFYGNIIRNGLFENGLSEWTVIENNNGKVEITNSRGSSLIGDKAIKLFIPGESNNTLAGIKQEIILIPQTYYYIHINAKAHSSLISPILYLHIGSKCFNLHCQPFYTYYQILFSSESLTRTTLQLDTGAKFSSIPVTFYIDNILLYPQ